MFREADLDYLERRIREERARAEAAADPAAYRAHATLAQQYERELIALRQRQSSTSQSGHPEAQA